MKEAKCSNDFCVEMQRKLLHFTRVDSGQDNEPAPDEEEPEEKDREESEGGFNPKMPPVESNIPAAFSGRN